MDGRPCHAWDGCVSGVIFRPGMADILGNIKGSFILSLNDRPEVRKIFKSFHISAVETKYTIAGNSNAVAAKEVLISNRRIKL